MYIITPILYKINSNTLLVIAKFRIPDVEIRHAIRFLQGFTRTNIMIKIGHTQ